MLGVVDGGVVDDGGTDGVVDIILGVVVTSTDGVVVVTRIERVVELRLVVVEVEFDVVESVLESGVAMVG